MNKFGNFRQRCSGLFKDYFLSFITRNSRFQISALLEIARKMPSGPSRPKAAARETILLQAGGLNLDFFKEILVRPSAAAPLQRIANQ
jgi:hypothetical protein